MRETHLHPGLRRLRRSAALATCAALLVAGCGDSGGSDAGSDNGSDTSRSASDSTDTSLGEGQWLVVISTAGGADAETATSSYITYDPSTGEATKRVMPGVRAGSAGPDDAALLVSGDRRWAIPDTQVSRAQERSGKLTVFSLTDTSTRRLDVRALSGDRSVRPIGWAFDPREPATLRVVDTRNRVWTVPVTGGKATRTGTLAKGPWIFTNGFDRNTGEPWVESITSEKTRPAGKGAADTSAVERAGGTVLYSESPQLADLPKSPCRLGGGFTAEDGTTWMFCADKPQLTTHYLSDGSEEWKSYGEPSSPVAPEAASVSLVLPPA
ncbi:MAG TPA: hypothetical protein VFJ28_05340 [Marmoricola sp.]|nr:hypothetical protein [Marmoricola sp.]